MKKYVVMCAILALRLGILSAAAFEDEWGVITIPKGNPLHLGFAAALSGDYANYGSDERDGMTLALEDHGGEILGFNVEILIADDQCEELPAMVIADKFSADPLFVGLIGHMCSPSSLPASIIYAKHGLVMISPSTTAAEYTNRGLSNVFRTCFSDDVQGKVAAEYAINVLKLKTAAVLHDRSSYGQPIAENFKQTFEALGGTVSSYEGIARGDKDFRPTLVNMMPPAPQFLYFGGMAAEGVLIVRQMKAIGLTDALFMSDDGCFSVPDFIDAAGEASDKTYITFAQPQSGEYDVWETRFTDRFHHKPVTYSPQTYDATTAFLMALEKVAHLQDDGSLIIGKKALADAIRSLEFEGITGEIGFTETGNSKSRVVMYQVQEGEFVLAPGQ